MIVFTDRSEGLPELASLTFPELGFGFRATCAVLLQHNVKGKCGTPKVKGKSGPKSQARSGVEPRIPCRGETLWRDQRTKKRPRNSTSDESGKK